jgi:hypothetical protein
MTTWDNSSSHFERMEEYPNDEEEPLISANSGGSRNYHDSILVCYMHGGIDVLHNNHLMIDEFLYRSMLLGGWVGVRHGGWLWVRHVRVLLDAFA